MEQHDPAVALSRRGDEGGAVRQSRPHLRVHGDGGIGEHLPVHFHVVGHVKPAERARLLEGGQRLRRAPGQRSAKGPAAATQSDGKQLVSTLLEPRTGKADENAARFEPRVELFLGARDQLADIGKHDGRHLAVDQLVHGRRDVGLIWRYDVGVGRERALDVVKRREQGLRGLLGFARDDADPAPLRAGIEEMHRAGRSLARDLQPRDLIADFEWQIEMRLGFARALSKREGRLAEGLATAGERLDHARARTFNSAQHARGKLASVSGGLVQRQSRIVPLGAEHGEGALAAGKLGEAFSKGRSFAIIEAVGKPQHAIVRLAAELALERCGQCLAVRRVRLGREPGRAFAGLGGGDRTSDGVAGCRRCKHDSPAVTPGAVDGGVDRLAPLRPMGRRGPAIVDDEEERPGSGKVLPVGVEHGAGQRQHDQGREQHSQRREPPGAVGRRLLGRLQFLEQPRRREHYVMGARRRQPQQPPDGGERGEAQEYPGLQKTDGAEGHHGR